MKKGEIGRKGEEAAEEHLKEKGFRVLKRNYKNKYAEIDMVAKKGEETVFVEVRSTSTEYFGTPEETVNQRKIEKLKKNVLAYTTFENVEGPFRIDLICVSFNRKGELEEIKHYENITN